MVLLALPALAQHDHAMHHEAPETPAQPLGIDEARDGSGTSWLPDTTPMLGLHDTAKGWGLMLHWNVFAQYIDETGDRGDDQLGSVNWVMGMADRPMAGGAFTARAMLTIEPLTVRTCGYPDLLASGEDCDGQPLHDRQHPHDLFMELAVRYRHEFTKAVAYDVYAAVVGDPALGPAAFPHRPSARMNPLAPISHHWMDSSHISFGVVTAGVYGKKWKAEGSIFNGREPDDDRYDFDFGPLDSYSGRVWFLPSENWAIQVSAGHLEEAEVEADGSRGDENRITASAIFERRAWEATVAWGRDDPPDAESTDALLVETNVTLASRHVVFGRVEINEKSGEDLVLDPSLDDHIGTLVKAQLGYAYEFRSFGRCVFAAGGSVWVSYVPDAFAPAYGGNTSPGFAVFVNFHPTVMTHH